MLFIDNVISFTKCILRQLRQDEISSVWNVNLDIKYTGKHSVHWR